MKPRETLVAVLLMGVAATVLTQVVKESRAEPAVASGGTNAMSHSSPATNATHKVFAYYFHRTVRCETCRTIEAQAHATIEAEFADSLKNGRLEWHVINIEEGGNKHFAKDYDLTMPSLVLVDSSDGRQVRWTKLERIWDLVHTPPAFGQYVQDELRAYLIGPLSARRKIERN